MIVCAGNNESFEFAISIGIGITQSVIKLTQILSEKKCEEIIFIGSAGIYGGAKIGEIYESKSASNLEISYLQNLSYSPILGEIYSNVSCETFRINSSNFITTDEKIAKKFFEFGLNLENMEFFSVSQVAQNFGIPFTGIFYTTNFCNKNAHNDFIKNLKNAKKELENELKNRGLI